MSFLFILLAVAIVGWAMHLVASWDSVFSLLGFLLGALGALGFVSAVLFIPVARMDATSNMHKADAIRATLDAARDEGASLELAAIQAEVARVNAWIAKAKYWKGTTFGIYWPDEVNDLEPIR